ncbi:cyclase family protein [Haloglomus halophilum]|uniref:cyclase family protein n=1 Tax=Haloglomus halophilum TaxID=2962672 RepID=UPI0020C94502|nr:cyclase family protein [Haloglomus halophilum]
MLSLADAELVDLSIGLEPGAASEPWPPDVEYFDHDQGAQLLSENLHGLGYDVDASDFPDRHGLAWEEVHAIPHAGTHLDAPWHYGPETGGEPARTIDEVPLEWCRGNAVVLDVRDMDAGEEITPDDIDARLDALDHELSEGELVFLQTGADELWGSAEYLQQFPGMGAAATKHLVEQGVRVIGTDAYGFDKPFAEMGRRFADSGESEELWPAHFAGRDVEYCQIEKMANLDRLPRRTDVPVVCFPISIEGASAGWVRPVAMFEPGMLPDGGDALAADGGIPVNGGGAR